MTVVISQTFRYGFWEGFKVGLTPIFTDGPIVLLAFFILSRFSHTNLLLAVISLAGAFFLVFLALENLRAKPPQQSAVEIKAHSFRKGIVANALNPYPYLFYFTVGGSVILSALQINVLSAVLFILGVTLAVVAAKTLIAFLASQSRSFISSRWYIYVVRVLGLVLLWFAFSFFREAFLLFRHL